MEILYDLAARLMESGGHALQLQAERQPLLLFLDGRGQQAPTVVPADLIQQLLAECGKRIFLDVGDFRVQRVAHDAVRLTPILQAPGAAALGIPEAALSEWLARPGLSLVCGRADAWAALIDALNARTRNHIVILEQSMEWFHYHKMSMMSQRECGLDFIDWPAALASSALTGCRGLALRPPWQRRPLAAALEVARGDQWTLLHCPAGSTERAVPALLELFAPEQRPFYAGRVGQLLNTIFSFQPGRLDALEARWPVRCAIYEQKFDRRLQPTRSWTLP